MYLFLIPLFFGFVCNWASAFTHFFSRRMGEQKGQQASFVLRNILGIPVWVIGLIMAYRQPAVLIFIPRPALEIFAWLLLLLGTVPMVWALQRLGLRPRLTLCPSPGAPGRDRPTPAHPRLPRLYEKSAPLFPPLRK